MTRKFLCILTLGASMAAASARENLLILVDPTTRGLAGAVWDQLMDQIGRRETNFNVSVREVPRWTRQWVTNDWPALNIRSNIVFGGNWHTVWLVGSHPYLITGSHIDDGHENRCITTDVWLAVSHFAFVDTTNWSMSGYDPTGYPLNRNIAGDGRPDQITGTKARRVARLDFAALTQPGDDSNWASGCLVGMSKSPAIDEGLALRAYLTNNLAYRTGEWTTTATGLVAGGLWQSAPYYYITNSNTSVTWTKNGGYAPGGTSRYYYENWDSNEVEQMYDGNCVPTRVLVDFCYRSYAMEIYRAYNLPFRRLFPGREPNPYAIVFVWTTAAPWWLTATSDRITGDMIDTSIAANGTEWPFTRQFYGDPTCPIVPQTGRRGTLTITNITFTTSP